MDNMYDASNIHNLPVYYNYGIGSAGFGACIDKRHFYKIISIRNTIF